MSAPPSVPASVRWLEYLAEADRYNRAVDDLQVAQQRRDEAWAAWEREKGAAK